MKRIELTQGYVAMVDDEDFPAVAQYKWYAHIEPRNGVVYARRNVRVAPGKQVTRLMHRELLGIEDGAVKVDHADHDGLNNQRANLRACTHAENIRNACKRQAANSKYKGVRRHGAHWQARINRKAVGTYSTEIQAAVAYNEAARRVFGQFAAINQV